jgi:(2Fe-2S) ferredoxin
MREVSPPRAHLFVCTNRREASPLGPGCGEHGDALYDALKREVGARGLVADVWVTRTQCLGVCPREGATVARYPNAEIVADAHASDAAALLDSALAAPAPLDDLEALQKKKVLDLARRLKPGLTSEDIQNPHDFPELDDPDWHYEDGVLTGIQSVIAALRAKKP